MKKEYSMIPPSMSEMETYGFSWMDFVTAIPSPLIVVTSYKSNGKPNACMQSWACFSGNPKGFYAILSNVNKNGHMYNTIKDTGECVLNFPSVDVYDCCLNTITNNQWEADEITVSGLTAEPATLVKAPRIKECFLSLECRYVWEHAIAEDSSHTVMCLEAVNICMEEANLNEAGKGRYGEGGFIYNVHHPVDPETYNGKAHDYIAVLQKIRDTGEY